MYRMLPIGLALALFAAASTAPCRAQSVNSGVRDQAHLFSPEATRQAERALQAIGREDHWQVLIETVDSLNGQDARDRAIADAKARNIHGLIILVSKDDHKIMVEPSDSARKVFTKARTTAIYDAMSKAFRAKDFDQGLRDAVIMIREDLAGVGPAAAGPVKEGVRDRAQMFSPGAVREADRALRALRREARWQVVVETVDSLEGQDARHRAIADAKEQDLHGLIILISKNDHKLRVVPSRSAEVVFSKERVEAISTLLERSFRDEKFDEGLLAAVAEIRRDAGLTPEPAGIGREARPEAKAEGGEDEDARSKSHPISAWSGSADKTAPPEIEPPAPPLHRSELPAPSPAAPMPVPRQGSNVLPLILLGVGVLIFLWLLSRVFRRPQQRDYYGGPAPGVGGQPQPIGPAAGFGPAPRPSAPPVMNPGSAPGVPPTAHPGSGPAGPLVANPGYPAGGYGAPPPPQRPGGGFVSGALGGLGGAIVGNILYDKFGHPHPASEAPPTGGVSHTGGIVPPAPPEGGVEPPAPSETYDPVAGAGGDWGGGSEQGQPTSDWGGSGDAGAGGDWSTGQPQEAPSESPDASGEWSEPGDAGAGGDWGGSEVV
jgi:uncharacterized membrane protein YgcG